MSIKNRLIYKDIMYDFLRDLNPVLQALVGTGFTYSVTALGAAVVFVKETISARMLNGFWDLQRV